MFPGPLPLLLGFAVGLVLGLLGGGGSILALPIFLYVLHVPTKPAIAMSLGVVGMAAFIGFLTHLRARNVNLRVGIPFGLCAMVAAFVTARITHLVPEQVQLALFAAFAFTAAFFMLRDSFKAPAIQRAEASRTPHFSPLVAVEAIGVGALTSLIGAGGGFVIVPALVLIAHVPIRPAIGSSLLIITLNALSGFLGYLGQVPIAWPLVLSFTGVSAVGAIIGTRLNRHVPQARIKQAFAVLIILLGTYLIVRRLMVK